MDSAYVVLFCFIVALLVFSLLEVLITFIFNRSHLSWSSTLCTNAYFGCMMLAVVEYVAELYFIPSMKHHTPIIGIGAIMMVLGEMVRKIGQLTAQSNFTHVIATHSTRAPTHTLIKHGIYRIFRHPGYFGFYLWAVGGQVMLANPVSFCIFVYVLWNFFAHRIEHEEMLLIQFFGHEYAEYRNKTPTWIPFVP